MPLFRRGLCDRIGEPESETKMPRSVTRAITVGQGAKRGDRRSETGERRGALVNRIAILRSRRVLQLETLSIPVNR
jgi:hypothetical protein